MAELLTLLFLVAIGYGVYRVVKYVRYRNELARARDRVLAGMANMPDRRAEAVFNGGTVASDDARDARLTRAVESLAGDGAGIGINIEGRHGSPRAGTGPRWLLLQR